MKTTIPFATFDLQSLLNTVADFTDAVFGEEFQAATLATESEREDLSDQDWDDLPRFERAQRFPELEEKLKNGETLVLDIAEPYVGEPISFVDGSKVDVSEDEGFSGGEADSTVLFLDLDATTGDLHIETGMQCSNGCMCPPSLHRGSIGTLDQLVEAFLKRFIKS